MPLIPQHQVTEDLKFEGFLFTAETGNSSSMESQSASILKVFRAAKIGSMANEGIVTHGPCGISAADDASGIG